MKPGFCLVTQTWGKNFEDSSFSLIYLLDLIGASTESSSVDEDEEEGSSHLERFDFFGSYSSSDEVRLR